MLHIESRLSRCLPWVVVGRPLHPAAIVTYVYGYALPGVHKYEAGDKVEVKSVLCLCAYAYALFRLCFRVCACLRVYSCVRACATITHRLSLREHV